MGTRGVVGFVADKKWYVTYNHFDSYPEGLGVDVLKLCNRVLDWEKVKENVKKVTLVSEDTKPSRTEIKKYRQYADLGVGKQKITSWYCLLRDLQGTPILEKVATGEVSHMIDDHLFMKDSLFCEWGYIIDLDHNQLLVYKGFQKHSYLLNILPPDISYDYFDDGYFPVKWVACFNIDDLPSKAEFLKWFGED